MPPYIPPPLKKLNLLAESYFVMADYRLDACHGHLHNENDSMPKLQRTRKTWEKAHFDFFAEMDAVMAKYADPATRQQIVQRRVALNVPYGMIDDAHMGSVYAAWHEISDLLRLAVLAKSEGDGAGFSEYVLFTVVALNTMVEYVTGDYGADARYRIGRVIWPNYIQDFGSTLYARAQSHVQQIGMAPTLAAKLERVNRALDDAQTPFMEDNKRGFTHRWAAAQNDLREAVNSLIEYECAVRDATLKATQVSVTRPPTGRGKAKRKARKLRATPRQREVMEAVSKCNGNVTEAAKQLGISKQRVSAVMLAAKRTANAAGRGKHSVLAKQTIPAGDVSTDTGKSDKGYGRAIRVKR